jgi:hypothetical protein
MSTQERFPRLVAEWKQQSRSLSNTAQMAMLQPYQRMIGMGLSAVPLILEELHREPDQWFWALEAITEEDPVPPRTPARSIRWPKLGSNGVNSDVSLADEVTPTERGSAAW